MAGEAEKWRQSAVAIFAAFGDAVFDAAITLYSSGAPVYDAASGRNIKASTSSTTKVAFVQLSEVKFQKAFGPDRSYVESEKTAYLLPPASGVKPNVGDEILISSTTPDEKYRIEALNTDSANLKAYYVVLLKPMAVP